MADAQLHPIEYPGIVEHMRRMYPSYNDERLINALLSMRMYLPAEYLARQTYDLARDDA